MIAKHTFRNNAFSFGLGILFLCSLAMILGLVMTSTAYAACNFDSFWSGGCNKDIERALTPPPPNTWIPEPTPPNCGSLNQRPCTVVERIPSCKDGLTESIAQNKCMTTPAGKLPFFATLNEMGDIAVKAGKEGQAACLARLNPMAGSQPKGIFGHMAFSGIPPQQAGYVMTGFICAAPRMLDTLSSLRDLDPIFWRNFEIAFNQMFNSKPCADNPDPAGRVACAVGMMVIDDAFNDTICTIKSFQAVPDLIGSAGAPNTIEAYNRLGEGLFILMQWTFEQYLSAMGAAPVKAKFKAKEIQRRQMSDLKKGTGRDAHEIERSVDRVLEIFKNVMLVRSIDVLYDRLQRIPECNNAVGQGLRIEIAMTNAVASIPKGSEAAVKTGNLYMVNSAGQLLYFQHDEHARFTISGKIIGNGWGGFKFLQAVQKSDGGGALYAVAQNGDLLYYEHDVSGNFTVSGKVIGQGWGGFKNFMAARFGQLYAVTPNGDLVVYYHDTNLKFTTSNVVIGNGWGGFSRLISGGANAFYAQNNDGNLRYYYHTGTTGPFSIANKVIGNGWGFKYLASSGNGTLYGVNDFGELLFYRHDVNHAFVPGSGKVIGIGWGNPGIYGLIAGQH